ncbi:MAG: sigma-54-dependent Fis family transcriptional regulator [Deltaproteobacteria bacterium]|nr:sigma-54-dependent Fis family transcriptional regulator [Deltaproteobacteria bacterium]
MAKVLIIDDDVLMNESLARLIGRMGHQVGRAFTLAEGLSLVHAESYDVVFLDVRMPDGNGLEALPQIQKAASAPEVIIITAYGDRDGAKLAIENGAWDYIGKPVSIDGLTLPLIRALQYREEKKARKCPIVLRRDEIIGKSPRMLAALERLAQAAGSGANILITGATGTGKELFAKAIHENSVRAMGRFVVVDCAALPESVVESILFGHEKGAYTGADRTKKGLVEQAHGGTLFLDEVGELPLAIQKAFLRVIQERRFRPVGAEREVTSDFRLISATNRSLEEMVERGLFRSDLLFRLRSFVIDIPLLRERAEDTKDLAIHYINRFCELYQMEIKGLSPEFIETLTRYDWPGNVRELINTVEHVLAVARYEPTLFPAHLPTNLRIKLAQASFTPHGSPPFEAVIPPVPLPQIPEDLPNYEDFKAIQEHRYIERLAAVTGGNRKEACRISGLSRTRLFQLLKKYDPDHQGEE